MEETNKREPTVVWSLVWNAQLSQDTMEIGHAGGGLLVLPSLPVARTPHLLSHWCASCERPGTFHLRPVLNLCYSACQGTNCSLKTLWSQLRATPPGERVPLVICTPLDIDCSRAKRPLLYSEDLDGRHILTVTYLFCCVNSSLLCIMLLEHVLAYLSVACKIALFWF